jgi:uncharacterized protein
MSATRPIAAGERVELLDALRGLALFGILVVNMGAFKADFFGPPRHDDPLDVAATWLIAFGFQTKFYVLFSFLFGYGFSVQLARAAERGERAAGRYLRRLLGLLLLGLAHAILLFYGDILVTYAIFGLVLLLFRRVRGSVLVGLAAVLLFGSALLFAGLGALASTAGEPEPAEVARERDQQAREAERRAAAYRGTPAEAIGERLREYPGTLAFALLGQGPTILAMFLLGLWAGRRRLAEHPEEHAPLLRRLLALGLHVGVPGALAWATYRTLYGFTFDARFLYAAALNFGTAPFLTAVYAIALATLWRDGRWRARLAPLAPVGRMALTNYLLQSATGAFLFTGYGLALYGRVGAALGLALSLAIFAAQVPLSAWWLRRFRFGPAEWVLRSLTYGRRQPFRIRAAAAET